MVVFATLLLLTQTVSPDVVVSAPAIRAEQQRCQRGGCTPADDAQLSIALADAEFRDGAYGKALRTLTAAVSRNRRHAATDPKPVAMIYQALATVALHEGHEDIYRQAVRGRVRVLKDNLPPSDPAVISAGHAFGDMYLKLGNPRAAETAFNEAEKRAKAAGSERSAMGMALRRAWIATVTGNRGDARRILAEVAARPIARDPAMATVLRVMQVRIAVHGGDEAQIASALRGLSIRQGEQPILLWGPAFPVDSTAAANADARKFSVPEPFRPSVSNAQNLQWADVGFWIRPDGKTAEAEILRSSPYLPWGNAALKQIAGRRYVPTTHVGNAPVDAEEGVYRVERITRRLKYLTAIESRIPIRVATGEFETLNLVEPGGAPAKITPASRPPPALP